MRVSQFYKRNPAEWMDGTNNLTLEQEAAYSRIVDATALYDQAPRHNLNVLCGLWRCAPRKANRLLGELIEAGKVAIIDGRIAAPILRKMAARPAIPAWVREIVWQRDGERCVYCGDTQGPFHLDHMIPWSRGGEHSAGNLCVACVACNFEKGAMTPEEWANEARS